MVHSEGKIMVKWSANNLWFKPFITTPYLIHGEIILANGSKFLISFIYAHNDSQDRLDLWYSLSFLAQSSIILSLIMGDFNYNLYTYDKKEVIILPLIGFRLSGIVYLIMVYWN